LPVSFTEVLVSFNRCELLQYLHRLILVSEPCRLPACFIYLCPGECVNIQPRFPDGMRYFGIVVFVFFE